MAAARRKPRRASAACAKSRCGADRAGRERAARSTHRNPHSTTQAEPGASCEQHPSATSPIGRRRPRQRESHAAYVAPTSVVTVSPSTVFVVGHVSTKRCAPCRNASANCACSGRRRRRCRAESDLADSRRSANDGRHNRSVNVRRGLVLQLSIAAKHRRAPRNDHPEREQVEQRARLHR